MDSSLLKRIAFTLALGLSGTIIAVAGAHHASTVLPGQRKAGLVIPTTYVTASVGCKPAMQGRYCTHSQLVRPGTNSIVYDLGPGSTMVNAGTYDQLGIGSGAPPAGGFPTSTISW
jgi:hypothetical protein